MPLTWNSVTGPEYIKVPVSARISGVVIDPTGDAARMAVVAEGSNPVGGDWGAATWETDSSGAAPVYLARKLFGPLAAGSYIVWVEVTHAPETIKRPAGRLVVA